MAEKLTLKAALRNVVLGGGIVILTPMIAKLIPANMQIPLGNIATVAGLAVAGALAYALNNYVVSLIR